MQNNAYNRKLDVIKKKYNDLIFLSAIIDLFDVGVSNRENTDLDKIYLLFKAEERISEKSNKIPLMTAELKLEIVKCSKELATIGIVPILRYIYCRKLYIGN